MSALRVMTLIVGGLWVCALVVLFPALGRGDWMLVGWVIGACAWAGIAWMWCKVAEVRQGTVEFLTGPD